MGHLLEKWLLCSGLSLQFSSTHVCSCKNTGEYTNTSHVGHGPLTKQGWCRPSAWHMIFTCAYVRGSTQWVSPWWPSIGDSFCFTFGVILVCPLHWWQILGQIWDLLAITFWHNIFYYASFTLSIIYIWDMWKSRSFPSHTTKPKKKRFKGCYLKQRHS